MTRDLGTSELRLYETHREVLDQVRTGTADLALTEAVDPHPNLDSRPIHDDDVLTELPQGHRLSGRTPLTWTDLAGKTFIAFNKDSSVRRLTYLAFARARAGFTTVVETRAVATAGGMIAAGLGVSAVPELVLPLLSFAGVVTQPLTAPSITQAGRSHPPTATPFRCRDPLPAPPPGNDQRQKRYQRHIHRQAHAQMITTVG